MTFNSMFIGGIYINNDDIMDFKEMIDVVALSQNKSRLSELTNIYNIISNPNSKKDSKELNINFLKLKLIILKKRIANYERINNNRNSKDLNLVYEYLQWKYEKTDIEKMINLHNYNKVAETAPEVKLLDKFHKTKCLICLRSVFKINTVITNCGHSFCKGCFQLWCSQNKAFKCPCCKIWYPKFVKFIEPDPRFKPSHFTTSS